MATEGGFSADEDGGKDSSNATNFSEDFIRKMEEWERMKGLAGFYLSYVYYVHVYVISNHANIQCVLETLFLACIERLFVVVILKKFMNVSVYYK